MTALGNGDPAALLALESGVEWRALSIRQPWAWLVVRGFKEVENRTWRTKRRGRILIHAGKAVDSAGWHLVRERFPDIPLPGLTSLPRGGIVGHAMLVDCVQVSTSPWFSGPWGFVLEDPQEIPMIPMPGRLGFFPVASAVNGRP